MKGRIERREEPCIAALAACLQQAGGDLLVSLGRVGSEADRREGTLHDIGGSQVPPVSSREVEEGEHAIPVST